MSERVEWGLVLAAAAAAGAAERWGAPAWSAAGLLACWAVARSLRRAPLRPAGAAAVWLLLLASAVLATLVAYERAGAAVELVRIAATAALFFTLVEAPANARRWAARGLALLATALAVYWPLQYDFGILARKFALLGELGAALRERLPPPPGPSVDANIAAAVLGLGLPFALGWLASARDPRSRVVAALAAVVVGAALVLTGSRGAWMGSALAALATAAAIAAGRSRPPARRRVRWTGAALLAVAIAGGLVLRGVDRAPVAAGDAPLAQSRTELWGQSLRLAGEYPFTGSGLGTFPMVHGAYGLLLHVPLQHHAHNTVLEIAIEQGALGVLAVLLAAVALARRWRWAAAAGADTTTWAGIAAVTGAAVHGLVDVPLYGARTLPLFGVAAGIAWAVPAGDERVLRESPRRRGTLAIAVAAAAAAAVALVAVEPHLRARWHGNLGALQQTRRELGVYDPDRFRTLTLDHVRRTVDLDPARLELRRALDLDPRSTVALLRLTDIALSLGEWSRALELARRARAADPADARTALLLGDALVAQGRSAHAAAAVRGVPWAAARIGGQAWYRYWEAADAERAAAAWETVLLLEPGNQGASYWLEEARRRLAARSPDAQRPNLPRK